MRVRREGRAVSLAWFPHIIEKTNFPTQKLLTSNLLKVVVHSLYRIKYYCSRRFQISIAHKKQFCSLYLGRDFVYRLKGEEWKVKHILINYESSDNSIKSLQLYNAQTILPLDGPKNSTPKVKIICLETNLHHIGPGSVR